MIQLGLPSLLLPSSTQSVTVGIIKGKRGEEQREIFAFEGESLRDNGQSDNEARYDDHVVRE